MPPRHDSASDITLPRATSLLGTMPRALTDDPFGDEPTLNRRADDITIDRRFDDVTVKRDIHVKPGRWHVELELEADQIARLHRLGLGSDAVVWREGFTEWKPLLEPPEIREAIDALKARAPSSMKSALRRATLDRIANMSRPVAAATQTVSPRRRANTDPALRLYAALNRRGTPRDTLELAPAPKITTAPVEAPLAAPVVVPMALPPRDSTPPVSTPIARPRGSKLLTLATHLGFALAGAALTILLFSVGPLRSPSVGGPVAPAAASRPVPTAAPAAAPETKPPPPDAPVSVQSLAVETPAPATTAAPSTQSKREPRQTESKASPAERAPAPSSSQSSGPDRNKIARALSSAAGAAAACGVGGSARVVATFSPSGVVRRVAIDGPTPELTDRGCVLRAIARARIPPFSGDPITVRKTVSF